MLRFIRRLYPSCCTYDGTSPTTSTAPTSSDGYPRPTWSLWANRRTRFDGPNGTCWIPRQSWSNGTYGGYGTCRTTGTTRCSCSSCSTLSTNLSSLGSNYWTAAGCSCSSTRSSTSTSLWMPSSMPGPKRCRLLQPSSTSRTYVRPSSSTSSTTTTTTSHLYACTSSTTPNVCPTCNVCPSKNASSTTSNDDGVSTILCPKLLHGLMTNVEAINTYHELAIHFL